MNKKYGGLTPEERRERIAQKNGNKTLYASTIDNRSDFLVEMLMCIYEAEAEVDDAMDSPIEDVIDSVDDVDSDDSDVTINIDIETESSSLFGSRYYY